MRKFLTSACGRLCSLLIAVLALSSCTHQRAYMGVEGDVPYGTAGYYYTSDGRPYRNHKPPKPPKHKKPKKPKKPKKHKKHDNGRHNGWRNGRGHHDDWRDGRHDGHHGDHHR